VLEIIDLSIALSEDVPVFPGHPEISITIHSTHEEREGLVDCDEQSPIVHEIKLSEHSGTHVDAFNHCARAFRNQSIEKMPLEKFFTRGLCLDLSNALPSALINVDDIEIALSNDQLDLRSGDTVLLHTDHFRRTFGSSEYMTDFPGISVEVARYFGEIGIAAFGVEAPSPGIIGTSNDEVHVIGAEMGYTHYENLTNLHLCC